MSDGVDRRIQGQVVGYANALNNNANAVLGQQAAIYNGIGQSAWVIVRGSDPIAAFSSEARAKEAVELIKSGGGEECRVVGLNIRH